MTDDKAPPTALPPASQAPYPTHTAPHARSQADTRPGKIAAISEGAAVGALGISLIGGVFAAALGMLIAIPLLRRNPKAKAAVSEAVAAVTDPAKAAVKPAKAAVKSVVRQAKTPAKAATKAIRDTASAATKAVADITQAPTKPRAPRKPRTSGTRRPRSDRSD